MPQTYFSIVTDLGKNKIAAALAGGTTIILEEIAVGDGSGNPTTPDPTQTALVNEVHRANLSELKVDPVNPNYILSQIVIPTNIGGWTIRELGLFDEDGDLIAVANYPDSYKPLITEGAGREMIIRLIIMIEDGEDEAFELVIDPGVALATQQWVEAGYSFGAQVPGGKAGMNLRKSSDADGAVEWYAPFNRGSLPGVAIGFDGYGDTGIDPAPFVEDPFAFYFRGVVSDVTAGEGGSNVLGNTRGVAGFPSGTFSLIVNDDGDIKFYNERGGSDPANNIIAPATVNVPNGTPFECIMLVNPVNETIDFYVNGQPAGLGLDVSGMDLSSTKSLFLLCNAGATGVPDLNRRIEGIANEAAILTWAPTFNEAAEIYKLGLSAWLAANPSYNSGVHFVADPLDLLDGNWSVIPGDTIDSSDTFTSDGVSGVSRTYGLVTGQRYRLTIQHNTSASSVGVWNDNGSPNNTITASSEGTFDFVAVTPYIYIQNNSAGTTTITTFELRSLGAFADYKFKSGIGTQFLDSTPNINHGQLSLTDTAWTDPNLSGFEGIFTRFVQDADPIVNPIVEEPVPTVAANIQFNSNNTALPFSENFELITTDSPDSNSNGSVRVLTAGWYAMTCPVRLVSVTATTVISKVWVIVSEDDGVTWRPLNAVNEAAALGLRTSNTDLTVSGNLKQTVRLEEGWRIAIRIKASDIGHEFVYDAQENIAGPPNPLNDAPPTQPVRLILDEIRPT